MARNGNTVPTMGHVLAYLATTHYLKAVAAVGSDDAGTVHRDGDVEVLQADVVDHLVECTLKKCRVDRGDGLEAFASHTGAEGHRVLFGDAYVE